ncbi:facilitated trehalose transporter Tret1-2 homolog isoform X2 [Toxorhynchites rutilus septentrionalis]|uniref:facilitated trehalose transporter Tret1-2 homolog isoform X2 n=1 Tax=Toxorhynchites rutilus septentrionalis TaxID=329112 RepID=UPI00247ADD13|nr:facilitated trehalose transporter Tret1-2 homolog isoform X2 [Toxorhynchites rutilus septentrionalis]XP_055640399.1 facilitated trehalose transporter Tret1-2 homolog isoform X2 [Toxorhynchites rutilus septentrionalis]
MAIRENTEQNKDDAFREIIASCRSLSKYETNIKSAFPQIFSAIIAAAFHIVIGISLAYSAILIPQLEDPNSDVVVTKAQSSWIASIIVIMVPIGSLVAGVIMEFLGRLNTIKLAAIPCIIGWIAIALADNFFWIMVGRVLTGFACAIGTSPAIVYITEVSRPDMRGSLISSGPTIASLGMVIAYAKGAYMNWRLVAWINIIYTIVPVLLIQLFVPESPVWLVSKGRIEDAARSLKFLYKKYPQPEHTEQPLSEMHLNALLKERESRLREAERTVGANKSKLRGFLKPTGYKPMIILFWFFLIQQFSGIYITLFFAVTFIQDVGTEVNAFTASIFVGLTRFTMSLLNAWLLKKFARRHLTMVSTIGMAICMTVSGFFTLWIKEKTTTLTWVPVLCLLLYVCASMIGLLTIPWTMTAELFPMEIRGLGHSLSYSMANLLMFFAVQSYRSMADFLGGSHAVQWFFAVVSVFGFLFALIFLPETHGKSLAQIEAYFAGNQKRAPTAPVPRNMSNNHLRVTEHLIKSPSSNSFKVREAELMLKNKEVS